MNRHTTVGLVSGMILVAALGTSLYLFDNQASAEVTPFPSREKVISVTGQAQTTVDPDQLVITFGVENQEETAKDALSANSEAMTKIIDAIKSVGITEDELSTSRINIEPVYDSYQDKETKRYTQELVGYRVTNTIKVETSKLDAGADIIDSAVAAGANKIDNVFFTLTPQTQQKIKDELIEKAVLNAKSKAEDALAPLNHQIIGVKAVTLSDFGAPPPMPLYRTFDAAVAEGAMKSSTPVFSSDQEVSTTANVVFLIGSN